MDLTALEALFTLRDELAQPLADLAAEQLDERPGHAGAGKPETAAADKTDEQVKRALDKVLEVRRGVAALLEKPPSDAAALSGLLAAVTRPFLLSDETTNASTPEPARKV